MSNENKSIQEKLTELEAMVAWFEGDDFLLEDSIEMYKKAEQLAQEIEQELLDFKNQVVVLKKKFNDE